MVVGSGWRRTRGMAWRAGATWMAGAILLAALLAAGPPGPGVAYVQAGTFGVGEVGPAGPVFSGPHQYPFVCGTVESGWASRWSTTTTASARP